MLSFIDSLMQEYIKSIQEPYLYELHQYWEIKSRNNFPPKFIPEEWQKVYETTNCFAYALNLNRSAKCIFEYMPFYPECSNISDISEYITDFLKRIGISTTQIRCPVSSSNKHYTIGLFYSETRDDVHLIRRDANNSWSHKMGWYSFPEELGNDLSEIIDKLENNTYKLCGFLEIKSAKNKYD